MSTEINNENKIKNNPATIADTSPETSPAAAATPDQANVQLERTTYDIIRNRLGGQAMELRARLSRLNEVRRDVFGAIESKLLASDRISSAHNCICLL